MRWLQPFCKLFANRFLKPLGKNQLHANSQFCQMSREILTFATENLKRNEMKKILLMICALVLTMSAQAKTKVIDRPAYLSNTALYELKPMKVELTKKATIVHFHVVNAKWGGWNVAEARLVCNGDTLAFKSGRVITHDGDKVLAEEPFELGKNIEKNIQRDSLIMTFEPLPKGAETFDYLGKDGRRRGREIKGIKVSE